MSFIEINKKNYFHNLKVLSHHLGSCEKLSVVLKDNAYGHGLLEMAKLSCEFGIKRAIVRNVDEAKEIDSYFEHIIILSPKKQTKPNQKFSFVINNLSDISSMDANCSVHLKIDTGMHRNGIDICDIEKAYEKIKEKNLILDGVMTHFRSADELSSELFWQMKIWKSVKKKVLELTDKYGFNMPCFHSANSATVFRIKSYDDNFARCGIATYGYMQMPKCFKVADLKPVLSLWAEKIATRVLQKGQRIGYGGEFEVQKKMIVSTYDIGYADGFFRHDGKSKLQTSYKKEFLGRVSMDLCEIESDKQKISLFNNATYIAKHFNTISYDVLTRLSPKISRIVI